MSFVKDPDVGANGSSGSSYLTARCCRRNDAGGGASSDRSEVPYVRWWCYHLVKRRVVE